MEELIESIKSDAEVIVTTADGSKAKGFIQELSIDHYPLSAEMNIRLTSYSGSTGRKLNKKVLICVGQ